MNFTTQVYSAFAAELDAMEAEKTAGARRAVRLAQAIEKRVVDAHKAYKRSPDLGDLPDAFNRATQKLKARTKSYREKYDRDVFGAGMSNEYPRVSSFSGGPTHLGVKERAHIPVSQLRARAAMHTEQPVRRQSRPYYDY
jgi:hypothetical protein